MQHSLRLRLQQHKANKAADNACMTGGGSLKGFHGMGDGQNWVKISVPHPLTRSIVE
jgi:hypothetical protein